MHHFWELPQRKCSNLTNIIITVENYVTQGGDWGFYITRALGKLYPENVRASHINMIKAKQPSFSSHPRLAIRLSIQSYTQDEKQGLQRTERFAKEGRGKNPARLYFNRCLKGIRLLYRASDQASDSCIRIEWLTCCIACLDLWKITRLDRCLPMDWGRNIHLD